MMANDDALQQKFIVNTPMIIVALHVDNNVYKNCLFFLLTEKIEVEKY